jgi:ABC-type multidrug transport system ATPase subunit
MSRIIEVNELTKSYGKQKVVDAISFEVVKGEILEFWAPMALAKRLP